MSEYMGEIVRAEAGRDKGELFCVVGVDRDRQRLLLANGKRRRAGRPKSKNMDHVTHLDRGAFDHPAIEKLKQGAPVSDRELRRALAAFKEGIPLG